MTKRPHISNKVLVQIAIQQSMNGWISCPLCHAPLFPEEPRILEHMVPHELGGSSDAENLRFVHKDCASRKTNGSKATSAGGDLHKIAKGKRLERARLAHEAAVLGKTFKPEEPYTFVKRKSRPIPSRPFPTRKPRNGHA